MTKRYGQDCPVAKTLEIIGDRWTLLIIRDLLPGKRRFQDLEGSLKRIAPNILTERLKLLEKHDLVSRRLYSKHPPRSEYALTGKGKDLGQIIMTLAMWGGRHLNQRPSVLHSECGKPVELHFHCTECARRVPLSGLRPNKMSSVSRTSTPKRPRTI